MLSASLSRGVTLLLSGVPTLLSWAIISHQLSTSDFAGVSLALSLPLVFTFMLPALGAGIANAVPLGETAVHQAVARSLRANVMAGVIIFLGVTAIGLVKDWGALLGRGADDQFPMGLAVCVSTGLTAVWLAMLTGERVLIGFGETTKRIWASALTGPVMLLSTLGLVLVDHPPAWLYVLPTPLGLLAASALSLFFASRVPALSMRRVLSLVTRVKTGTTGKASTLALWLILVEAALAVPLWVLRPVVSVRGSDADVAAISLALQLAGPVFSLLVVLGQVTWPYFAANRGSLSASDLVRHSALFGGIACLLGLFFIAATVAAESLHLFGQRIGTATLVVTALYIATRGAWQPVRIAFSAPGTARSMAAVTVLGTMTFAIALWLVAPWGAVADMVAVTSSFAVNTLLCLAFLRTATRRPPVDASSSSASS